MKLRSEISQMLVGVVSVATLALASLVAGCSSEITCKDSCECQGLTDDELCISQCKQGKDDAAAAAKTAGCSDQYEALTGCQVDNATCDSQKLEYVYTTDDCKDETSAYAKCAGGSSSASTGSN